ncbi:MAG: helix-turn-helix domain-containing protein [Deltaproteobacteria bacterium]|nr:helix-turn-helix domain-containing protein [Deltaproteobacteria bacterium]
MKSHPHPIRLERERLGLTQVDLSLRSQLSLSTIRLAERGVATDRTLEAIAGVLGVSARKIAGPREAGHVR